MPEPHDKPDPASIPEFDRLMRRLVNVDPGEIEKGDAMPCPKCGERGAELLGMLRLEDEQPSVKVEEFKCQQCGHTFTKATDFWV
ncbi:MAG: hypothetical protein QF918_11460 [Pirellulaceae bacterium]|jgi:DNA-directed RNA polymerase subunit M/transcription elongation factor TFIIS|nr:hypothetical protein [Pirellulaceae bacterium]